MVESVGKMQVYYEVKRVELYTQILNCYAIHLKLI